MHKVADSGAPRPRARAATLAVTALAAAGLGCVGGPDQPADSRRHDAPKRGGVLTLLDEESPSSLDPGKTITSLGFQIAVATQRSLMVSRPGAGRLVPDLAAGEPLDSNGGRTLTVRIRRGVRFSPPVDREVRAADVKYAIERGFRRSVANVYARVYFGNLAGAPARHTVGHPRISGISAPDARTLVFRLRRPTAGTLVGALSMPLAAPVPPEYAAKFDRKKESDYALHQVATGPYMLQMDRSGRRVRGDQRWHLVMVRNPRWDSRTDERPAYLDRIDMRLGLKGATDDASIVARQVVAGSRMVTDNEPDSAVLQRLFARHRDQLDVVGSISIEWIKLNTTLPPLDNLNVRKAILAATDRSFLPKLGGGPLRGPVATHYLPPEIPGFHEAGGEAGFGVDYLAHPGGNLQVARRYMIKAGYPGGRYDGRQSLVLVDSTPRPEFGELFQRRLERLGLTVRRERKTFNATLKLCGRRSARVHICAGIDWVADFPDAQTMLAPNFKGDAIAEEDNQNFSQLNVPAIDAAMDRAEATTDPRQHARAWARVDEMIIRQAPAVPLVWTVRHGLRSKDVAAVANPQTGRYDLAYIWVRR